MFKYCNPPRSSNCQHIPVKLPKLRDLIPPPVGFIDRVIWRIRIAIVDRFGPRPHPWLPPGNLSAAVIDDLRILSTIDTVATGLSETLRTRIDYALRDAVTRLNISHVADVGPAEREIEYRGEPVPMTR